MANWLKRIFQEWLEITPVSRTYVTYHYAKGVDGKAVAIKARHWQRAVGASR